MELVSCFGSVRRCGASIFISGSDYFSILEMSNALILAVRIEAVAAAAGIIFVIIILTKLPKY